MITVYSTRTCGYCHALKQYLTSKDIKYEEVKVDEIPNGAEVLIEKSGQLGVPVVDIDGDVVVGFDRPTIDMLLSKKN